MTEATGTDATGTTATDATGTGETSMDGGALSTAGAVTCAGDEETIGFAVSEPATVVIAGAEVTGMESELCGRGALVAAAGARLPPLTGDAESLLGASAAELSTRLPRAGRCAGAVAFVAESAGAESDDSEAVDESGPSANAIGIAAKPELTPSAIASAPTRPT